MNNTPQNWKEAFEKYFRPFDIYMGEQRMSKDVFYKFIETQIAQAEKRGAEEMKKTILEYIPEDRQNPDDYEKFFNLAIKHCRQCVTLAPFPICNPPMCKISIL